MRDQAVVRCALIEAAAHFGWNASETAPAAWARLEYYFLLGPPIGRWLQAGRQRYTWWRLCVIEICLFTTGGKIRRFLLQEKALEKVQMYGSIYIVVHT